MNVKERYIIYCKKDSFINAFQEAIQLFSPDLTLGQLIVKGRGGIRNHTKWDAYRKLFSEYVYTYHLTHSADPHDKSVIQMELNPEPVENLIPIQFFLVPNHGPKVLCKISKEQINQVDIWRMLFLDIADDKRRSGGKYKLYKPALDNDNNDYQPGIYISPIFFH